MGRRIPKLVWIVAIAMVAVAAGAAHNELLGPVIRADPIRADDPLTVRFVVFNPAFAITLHNVDMTCLPLSLSGHGRDGRTWNARGEDFPLNVDVDVGPRMRFEYTCPIANTGFAGPVARVTAKIAIAYTRFGHRAQAMSGMLTWDSASRVWVGH